MAGPRRRRQPALPVSRPRIYEAGGIRRLHLRSDRLLSAGLSAAHHGRVRGLLGISDPPRRLLFPPVRQYPRLQQSGAAAVVGRRAGRPRRTASSSPISNLRFIARMAELGYPDGQYRHLRRAIRRSRRLFPRRARHSHRHAAARRQAAGSLRQDAPAARATGRAGGEGVRQSDRLHPAALGAGRLHVRAAIQDLLVAFVPADDARSDRRGSGPDADVGIRLHEAAGDHQGHSGRQSASTGSSVPISCKRVEFSAMLSPCAATFRPRR